MAIFLVNKLSDLFDEFVSIIYLVTFTLKDNWKPYGAETALTRNSLKINGGTVLLLAEKKKVFTDTSELNFVERPVYIYGYRELSGMPAWTVRQNCSYK